MAQMIVLDGVQIVCAALGVLLWGSNALGELSGWVNTADLVFAGCADVAVSHENQSRCYCEGYQEVPL
ncbi:MAG: hypothetical protein JJU48_06745 [Methylophaga sp.]|nr:hypothetical protein [Methylophaga sp.]